MPNLAPFNLFTTNTRAIHLSTTHFSGCSWLAVQIGKTHVELEVRQKCWQQEASNRAGAQSENEDKVSGANRGVDIDAEG